MKMLREMALFGILWSVAGQAAAQDDTVAFHRDLDRIEVYSKRPQEVALTRTRIDSIVLAEKQNLSLSELLYENTTVFIKHYGRGSEATASFRGTAPTHTQVWWNGIKVNSPLTGSVDFSNIPLFFVSEVSLKAGMSSVQDGAGALGGSIRIANKPDFGNRFSAEVTQSVGSFNTWDTYAGIRAGSEKFQSATRFFLNSSDNDFKFVNKSIIEDPDGERYHPVQRYQNAGYLKYGAMQEFFYRPRPEDVFSLVVWGLSSDRNLPSITSYEGSDARNISDQTTKNLRFSANYKHYARKAEWEILTGGDFDALDFVQKSRVSSGYLTQIDSHGTGRTLSSTFGLTLHPSEKHVISLSTQAASVTVDSHDRTNGQGFSKERGEISQLVGLYSHWTGRLATSVILRGSIVGESTFVVPVVGVEYAFLRQKNLRARVQVGRNENPPTLSDLYYLPGGNPDLKNEAGGSGEAGLEYDWNSERNTLKIGVDAYYSDIRDWILWLPSAKQYWTPVNVRRVESYGFEARLSNTYRNGRLKLYGMGTFAITHSVNRDNPRGPGDESVGKQLVYVPLYSANFFGKADYRSLYAGYQFTCYSRRYTTSSNDPSSRGSLHPYHMHDIFAGWDFSRRGSVEFKVFNIFDTAYETVMKRPMPGRNYAVVLRLNF
ncbi:MAG: TonB-dependent receptor [Rikenellaceae bacterium]|jgi:iron complex outermembrane receptor protein|nr:TonB-dependent receptor [Rikenellaceae bacterium]